jgi:hypothetical protein
MDTLQSNGRAAGIGPSHRWRDAQGGDVIMRTLGRTALIMAVVIAMGLSPAWAWGDLGHKIICDIAF